MKTLIINIYKNRPIKNGFNLSVMEIKNDYIECCTFDLMNFEIEIYNYFMEHGVDERMGYTTALKNLNIYKKYDRIYIVVNATIHHIKG